MGKGFPIGFLWGTATAAYQIEGADFEEGKSPSIWSAFSHTPGKIFKDQNADVACDHYHRLEEDVSLMKEMGVNAYRFSISWPRVLPEGNKKLNTRGIDFYRRLIDRLLENHIVPFVTLYHWDLPLALQEKMGGWEGRDIDQYFGDYASMMFQILGDQVKNWITLNEPFCSSHLGYSWGIHAPGITDIRRALVVGHNLLRSHGEATIRFREIVRDGQIGLVNVASWIEPASNSDEDRKTALLVNQANNEWFYLPLITGQYPEEARTFYEEIGVLPNFDPSDMNQIRQKPDFWGINYYTRNRIRLDLENPMMFSFLPPETETTEMGWEIYPEGLYQFLKMAYQSFGKIPIYITENGMADKDVLLHGSVHDEKRISYLRRHFEATQKAIEEGTDVRGYFIWSLMDNFEWSYGYDKRFGLLYTDYENNLRRIPKDSYYFMQKFLLEASH